MARERREYLGRHDVPRRLSRGLVDDLGGSNRAFLIDGTRAMVATGEVQSLIPVEDYVTSGVEYTLGNPSRWFFDIYSQDLHANSIHLLATGDYPGPDSIPGVYLEYGGSITDDGYAGAPYMSMNTYAPVDWYSSIILEAEGPWYRSILEVRGFSGGIGDPDGTPFISLWVGSSAQSPVLEPGAWGQLVVLNDAIRVGQPLEITRYLRHFGDTDTSIEFEDDQISLNVGGVEFLYIRETSQDDMLFNPWNADIDFRWDTLAGDGALFIEGSSGRIGVNVYSATIDAQLHVNQDSSGANIPTLHLEQDDVSEAFVKLTGKATSGGKGWSLVNNSDVPSAGNPIVWAKIAVVDEGNQVTDGEYYVPLYAVGQTTGAAKATDSLTVTEGTPSVSLSAPGWLGLNVAETATVIDSVAPSMVAASPSDSVALAESHTVNIS